MTKKEIKDLIIKSDYKNKDVVIWWQFENNDSLVKKAIKYDADFGGFEVYGVVNHTTEHDIINYISQFGDSKNFKLKILEVDDV